MNAQEIEPTEDQYDEWLNDCFGDVKIAGLSYDTAYTLKEVDPIAYRCGYNDYCSEYTQWECEECGSVYEDENDAEECCKDE